MQYSWITLMSYTIMPAAIAGIILYRKIIPSYYPIIYLLWIGLVNECISTVLISHRHSNSFNNNIYALLESLLLLWQFKNWGLLKRNGFVLLMLAILILWPWENLWLKQIFVFGHFFRMGYALMILVLSMLLLVKTGLKSMGHFRRDAKVVFCSGFVIYYSVNLLIEILLYYGMVDSKELSDLIFQAASFINAFVNLIYLMAVLWIPKKPLFIKEF